MWETKEQKALKEIIILLKEIVTLLIPRKAKGELNMLKVPAGQAGVIYTFTELDQNGKPIMPLGLIQFSSSNPAVATVDSSKQSTPDPTTFAVTVPVVAVSANADGTDGTADIVSTDIATTNQVTARDTLTVTSVTPPPPPPPVATSATGVLSLTPATAAPKNPLALG